MIVKNYEDEGYFMVQTLWVRSFITRCVDSRKLGGQEVDGRWTDVRSIKHWQLESRWLVDGPKLSGQGLRSSLVVLAVEPQVPDRQNHQ